MIENILKAMAMGEVKLTYKSLVSGKMKEVTGTLEGDKFIKQTSTSPSTYSIPVFEFNIF